MRILVKKMEDKNKKYINSFSDLDVYQRLSRLRKVVLIKIIVKLPKEERYDLIDQMRRACKAACAILAEGFAKRFQINHWKKYLTDVIGECNEMIDHLTVVQDIYSEYVNKDSIQIIKNEYEIAIKQLVTLGKSWISYHQNK